MTKRSPSLRPELRHSHVLLSGIFILTLPPTQPEKIKNKPKPTYLSTTSPVPKPTTMPPVQIRDRHMTTKPPPTKRDRSTTRRASAHSPKSSPATNSARRASVATTAVPMGSSTSSSSVIKSSPAVKSLPPTTRPEWIAPPGKYSPTQIPAPKFVTLGRKRGSPCTNEKGSGGSGVLKPITPVSLQTKENKVMQMQETPLSPLSRKSDTVASVITGARCESIEHEDSSPKGLGLSFEESTLRACDHKTAIPAPTSPISGIVDVAVSTHLPSNTSTLTNKSTEAKGLTSTTKDKKHDSLSSYIPSTTPKASTSTTCTISSPSSLPITHKPHSYLCPPSPSPLPSPSLLHPHISGIHISPSCTSGSLTHRLICGHLIITLAPEVCAANCEVAKATFAAARLKVQGFVVNVRVWMRSGGVLVVERKEMGKEREEKGGGVLGFWVEKCWAMTKVRTEGLKTVR